MNESMLEKMGMLQVQFLERPYKSLTAEELKQLANDDLDGKILTNEIIPQHLAPYCFPMIGMAMALRDAQQQGQVGRVFPGIPKEKLEDLLKFSNQLLNRLSNQGALMIYNYYDRQMPKAYRRDMQLPAEMEHLPMFSDFFYLDEKDYARYFEIRATLVKEKMEREQQAAN